MNRVSIEVVLYGERFNIWAIVAGGKYSFQAFAKKYQRKNKKEWAKMVKRLERIANYDLTHNKRQFNAVIPPDIFEAKTYNGLRVLFFYSKDDMIICTSGYPKQKGKTPKNQKKIALQRMKLFKEALKNRSVDYIVPEESHTPRRFPQ